jgi:hypothetical protein
MSLASWFRPRRFARRRRHSALPPRLERLEDRTLLNGHTLAAATLIHFNPANHTAAAEGFLDNPRAVDLFALHLQAGDTIAAAVDTSQAGGGLASALRVFNAVGTQIASAHPLEGNDTHLTFQAAAAGTYYVGVSDLGNTSYDPRVAASDAGTSPGLYQLHLSDTNAPLLPDLVGAAFQVVEGTALWGQTISVRYAVENRGGADASPFQVEVRLSTDNRLDGADTLLTTIQVAGLKAGTSTGGTLTLTLPGAPGKPPAGFQEPQAVYLGLRIDPANQVVESNKDNNSSQQRGTDWDSLRILTPAQENEPNTSFATATTLAVNARTSGTLGPQDVDFFQIVPAGPGRLSVTLHTTGFRARLSLYDSSDPPLLVNQSEGQPSAGVDPQIVQDLQADAGGTPFFLEVEGLDGGAGAYTLETEYLPALTPFQTMLIGDTPYAVTSGDFNGDGIPDLATVNFGSNDVSIFQGKRDGTYQNPVRYKVGSKPFALVVGDFTGTGIQDIAVANNDDNTVSILLGNGDGTFQPAKSYAGGNSPFDLVAGDFTGRKYADGRPILDLAVTDTGADDNGRYYVSVLLNQGDGTFAAPKRYYTGAFPFGIVTADFKRDGHLDLATVNNDTITGNNVSVLLGAGDGSFQELTGTDGNPLRFPVGSAPNSLVVGDFNGDGIPDLAVADRDSNDVTILLGNGDGTFHERKDATGKPVRPKVGNTPISIVTGDFNGDGIADLAVTNQLSNSVSVLLGNKDGSFQDAVNYPAGMDTFGLTAADLKRDGHLDLVATNTGDQSLSLLFGNKDGTFQKTVPLGSGTSPFAVATGDFNGDGVPDLALADVGPNATGNDVSILLGRGDGTYAAPVRYGVGSGPFSLVLGDFTGTGILDIATANKNTNDVSILLGRGDGTFQPEVRYAVGKAPVAIAVGDFNGDGTPDLLVADGEADDKGTYTVSLLEGRKDGTFGKEVRVALRKKPTALAVGDFTADGNLDFATANTDSNDVSVYLSNGDGTFRDGGDFQVGHKPVSLVAGDFTGNGILDLATANNDSNDVSVLMGRGDGTFQPEKRFGVGFRPSYLTPGDFNGDGRLDLAVVNGGNGDAATLRGSEDVSVLLGKGDGTFQPEIRVAVGGFPSTLAAADLNHDGHVDIVTANKTSIDVTVLLGQGDGHFQGATEVGVGASPSAIVRADLNGDGIPDLITVNRDTNDVSVLLGNGDGTFQPEKRFAVGLAPVAIARGDFNGDGRIDLAVANSGSNDVSVLLGLGDGNFAKEVRYAVGSAPDGIVTGDFTGDGHLDLAVANSGSNDVSVLLGKGDGTFTTRKETFAVGSHPSAIVPADFDGDGKLDLATSNLNDGDVSVLRGNGDGTFQSQKRYAVADKAGAKPSSLVVGDFDGDGNPDLATANSGFKNLSVLLNRGNGTFQNAKSYDTGNPPNAIVTDDFNGDGILDLATANASTSDISVLLGKGDGTFQEDHRFDRNSVGLGTGPSALVTGDFNGDGNLDLATANLISADVTPLLGLGASAPSPENAFVPVNSITATFRTSPVILDTDAAGGSDVAVLGQSGTIMVRHYSGQTGVFDAPVTVNPDPKFAARDLAVVRTPNGPVLAALDAKSSSISFYARKADGTFRRTGGIAVPGSFPTAIPVRLVAGDLTGDGRDDLVVAVGGSNMVYVYLQNAAGGFGPNPDYQSGVGANPADVMLADVNGDGRPDIVVANRDSGDVSVLLNDPKNPFGTELRFRAGLGLFGLPNATPPVQSALGTAGLAAGAFHAGDVTDLVVTASGANTFSLLRGTGTGGFLNPTPSSTFTTGQQPTVAVAGHFRGPNAPLDLAILNEGTGDVSVFLGDGKGGFTEQQVRYAAGSGATGLALGDVNGDGTPDLLIGNRFGDVLVLLGNGDGTYRPSGTVGHNVALAVTDLTGANKEDDFVFADESRDRVAVQYAQSGQSTLAGHANGIQAPGAVVTADLNGDGIPDVVVANGGGNDVLIYLGLPGGGFAPARSFFVGTDPVSVTVADLTGDRIPDLVVANKGSNDVSILLGQGKGANWTLTAGPRLQSGGLGPTAVAVMDVTGPNSKPDGIPDLLVTNSLSNNVALLPGVGRGFFDDRNPRTFATGIDPGPVFVGHFDDRPGFDLVTVNGGSNDLTFISDFLGDAVSESISTHGLTPVAATLHDVFGDGRLDLVVANRGDGVITLLTDGSDGFTFDQALDTGLHPTALAFSVVGSNFYVTDEGRDLAISLAFALPPISEGTQRVEALALAGLDLAFVPTLFTGPAAEAEFSTEEPGGAFLDAFSSSLVLANSRPGLESGDSEGIQSDVADPLGLGAPAIRFATESDDTLQREVERSRNRLLEPFTADDGALEAASNAVFRDGLVPNAGEGQGWWPLLEGGRGLLERIGSPLRPLPALSPLPLYPSGERGEGTVWQPLVHGAGQIGGAAVRLLRDALAPYLPSARPAKAEDVPATGRPVVEPAPDDVSAGPLLAPKDPRLEERLHASERLVPLFLAAGLLYPKWRGGDGEKSRAQSGRRWGVARRPRPNA